MIYQIFMTILQMSLTATVVVITVLLARCLMRRMPKKYSYLLWSIVAIRLLIPAGVSSPFSIFHWMDVPDLVQMGGFARGEQIVEKQDWDVQEFLSGTGADNRQQSVIDVAGKEDRQQSADDMAGTDMDNGLSVDAQLENGVIMEADQTDKLMGEEADLEQQKSLIPLWIRAGAWLWLAGMACYFLWNLGMVLKVKKHVAKAVHLRENIYECDQIPSPFVMGLLRPRIYIPFRLDEKEQEYILKHEQYHIRRHDPAIKTFSAILLGIYWFHPLVLISYLLMVRDMEMSCDEHVLLNSSGDIREMYCRSLLGFALNQRNLAFTSLAFGESDVTKRIRHIMKFQKGRKWVFLLAAVLITGVGAACLTDADTSEVLKASKEEQDQGGSIGQTDAYEKILASRKIHGILTEVVYYSEQEIQDEPSSGYYEGQTFRVRTKKQGKTTDTVELADIFGRKDMYFVARGFDLQVSDYDGDGEKNDFALGPYDPVAKPWHETADYAFFGIEEDGSITSYCTSAENDRYISVNGNEGYSPEFVCKKGKIWYEVPAENGIYSTEKRSIKLIRSDLQAEEITEGKSADADAQKPRSVSEQKEKLLEQKERLDTKVEAMSSREPVTILNQSEGIEDKSQKVVSGKSKAVPEGENRWE